MFFFSYLLGDETMNDFFFFFPDKKLFLQIIRLFLYIKEHHGIQTAFQFLGNVMDINI